MSENEALVLCLTIVTHDQAKAVHAIDILGRTGAGLMLDGTDVTLTLAKVESETVDEDVAVGGTDD